MGKKRCFVISPIGEEGSKTREHADDVYDYIIKPAMDECGMEAFRSDHLREPGKISDQMFRAILKDDLCIAVLTGNNPNVYYELAIAQSAARPVIILLEKCQILPFDIRDLRCVYYTLNPRPLFEKVYVKEIVEHVKNLEAIGWKVSSPFGALTPLGGQPAQDDNLRFFKQAMDYRKNPNVWMQLLEDTNNVFEIMGITLNSWREGKGFVDLLARKAAAGCKVRILLMHKDNPVLRHLINDTIQEVVYDEIIFVVDAMFNFFSRITEKIPNIEVRQILIGFPHFQLARTDQCAVFIQYFYALKSRHSPLWQCAQDSSLYALMTQEFDALWRANEVPVS